MFFLFGYLLGALTDEILAVTGLDKILKTKTFQTLLKTARTTPLQVNEQLNKKLINAIYKLKPEDLVALQGSVNTLLRQREVKHVLFKEARKKNSQFKSEILSTISEKELDKVELMSKLKSSWLDRGVYYPTGKGLSGWYGNLELTIKNAKSNPYLYFNVPLTTWDLMKEAQGRNGSGAGSVFWATYLRGYSVNRTSNLKSRAKNFQKKIKSNPVRQIKTKRYNKVKVLYQTYN